MGKKSEISVSQRLEIVLMIFRKQESISLLARRYGVSETTLHRWRDDFVKAGQSALAYGQGNAGAGSDTAKLKQLERDLSSCDYWVIL